MTRTDKLLLWVSGMFPTWALSKKMYWVVKLTCSLDKLQRETRERYYQAKRRISNA